MNADVTIEPLGRNGWQAAIAMIERFVAASPYRDVGADAPSIKAALQQAIQSGCVLLAYVAGKPVGLIGGVMFPMWINNGAKAAQELFWWVEPEHRASGVGRRLLEAFRTAMKQAGADYIVMISIGDPRADATYLASGFTAAETNYFHKVGD